MKTINTFISEKLKITPKGKSNGDISVVVFIDFLKWFYDVSSNYELSMDLINEQSDVLYQIEQYYGTSTVSAYKFLMGHKEDELEIQTKGKPGNYEFLVILKKGNNPKYSFLLDTKDILLRFYKDDEIPEDIKL